MDIDIIIALVAGVVFYALGFNLGRYHARYSRQHGEKNNC